MTKPYRTGIKYIHIFNREYNHGGITIAYQLAQDQPSGIFIGLSVCSASDRYSKQEGREYSTRRLLGEGCDFIPFEEVLTYLHTRYPVLVPAVRNKLTIADITETFIRELCATYVFSQLTPDLKFYAAENDWSW